MSKTKTIKSREVTEYEGSCKFCNKTITAWSESQLDWCMKLHIISKHPEKIEITVKGE